MKIKTNKILLLITAFFACLTLAFSGMAFTTASADTALSAGNYFYLNGEISSSVAFANDNVEVTVKNGDVLKFRNKLAIKTLELNYSLSDEIDGVKISVSGTSAYASGIVNEDGKLSTSVSNVLEITRSTDNAEKFSATYNGGDAVSNMALADVSNVLFDREQNFAKFGSFDVEGDQATKHEYQLKSYNGYSIVDVEIEFTLEENATGKFSLISVIHDASNVENTQTFKLKNDGAEFDKLVAPVAILASDAFTPVSANEYNVQKESIVSFAPTAYALINPPTSSNLDVTVTNGSARYYKDQKEISVSTSATVVVKDGERTVATYTLNPVDVKSDDVAPVYNATDKALELFEKAFKSKLVSDGEYGKDSAVYVSLGSDQYLELPSMEDLVSDDYANYTALKGNATLYYKTPTTSSQSSSLKVPLNSAGDYIFYVVFGDANGNKMKTEDFFTVDADDENDVKLNTSKYGAYVFTFTIIDNAPIVVEKASSQGEGYIGVKFTASKFKVVASSYNEKYVLKYSATKDANEEDWVEIPKASSVSDKEYNENGFTYDDIQAIAYDGSMSFTPDRKGYYKITCKVESDVTGRFDEATTDIIEVNGKPTVVKPDSKWLQNNVWSVVFLSVGTLCLIGIIVLLCIKPKEEIDE